MNKIFNYLVFFLIFAIFSCNKEKSDSVFFNPTDHVISTLGSKMRFDIRVPEKGFYNFSSIDSALHCEGNLCKEFLVPVSEMNEIAQNLSDTTIFQWEDMTAESPYPEDYCELLIYGGHNQTSGVYNDYMCSIGKSNSAANILSGLAKSFSGDARTAFDEIVSYLLN